MDGHHPAEVFRPSETADFEVLYRHWLRLGDDRMPPPAALDLVDLPFPLEDVIVLTVDRERDTFRFTRVGSRPLLWFRREVTGQTLAELSGHPFYGHFHAALDRCLVGRGPHRTVSEVDIGSRRFRCSALLLPFARDGRTPDLLLIATRTTALGATH
ncbi:hypothetical protein [Rhodospirillum centenum]|uniref:PAS domain-containing protein n=1 Tax=Rhodospirillum centenum (strain ATCC 51521 / SW) TaxID=414684 RepID=B6IRI1_RHOCS|nr:hypothetical protein [Rhodospirillum centenum]ACI98067.1 hypothetical protein RC1_0632 [Rhodospirillum centenum SW]